MKRNILTIICIFIVLSLSAQKINYSFGFQFNKLKIGSLTHTQEYPDASSGAGYYTIINGYNIKEKYNDNIGVKALANVDYSLTERFSIRSGLRLNLLRFQQKVSLKSDNSSIGVIPITDGGSINILADYGTPIGYDLDGNYYGQIVVNDLDVDLSKVGKTTVLYTEIPISALFKYRRLKFETGLTASIRTFSKRAVLESNELSGLSVNNRYNDSSINSIVWLMNLGISYNIISGVDFTMQYSRGLNGIYTNSIGNSGIPKYNIFSLGVTYNLK